MKQKEIKIKPFTLLHYPSLVELWEVHTSEDKKPVYIGRETLSMNRLWWTLEDAPHGSCKRKTLIRKDTVLVLCDENWEEVERDSNDREKYPTPLPTLIEAYQHAWSRIKPQYPNVRTEGWHDWLYRAAGNVRFWPVELISEEAICRFTHMGYSFQITRSLMRLKNKPAYYYSYYGMSSSRQDAYTLGKEWNEDLSEPIFSGHETQS